MDEEEIKQKRLETALLKNGLHRCNCKRKQCERFGKCEECIAYHALHKKFPPTCMRDRKTKKSKIMED